MSVKMMNVFHFLTKRHNGGKGPEKGLQIRVLSPVKNDYHTDRLAFIPAGTEILVDFGGDFGLYGVAEVQGVLHKIKVELDELHKLDWSEHQELIEQTLAA